VFSFRINADRDIIAGYRSKYSSLTLITNRPGGTVTGGGQYVTDQVVTIAAETYEGWNFENWTNENSKVVSGP